MKEKILLDTDIGSDIDDVICLSYLLHNPNCELLGITTVSGEAQKRAKIARNLCYRANRNIQVVSGISDPLIISQHQPVAQQACIVEKWIDSNKIENEDSINFMRKIIHENPHEVNLLCIGPLTNIAVLFTVDKETPSLLKNLILMCGSFYGSSPEVKKLEWNALCDPHAAKIVYDSKSENHFSIGLDVTQQITLTSNQIKENFKGKLSNVLDYAEVWFRDDNIVTFHDPLAAVSIFEPNIVRYEKGLVDVDIYNTNTLGLTKFIPEQYGPHNVAMDVNPANFFQHFFSVFGINYP